MNENLLEKLQHLFDIDVKVKREIYLSAPPLDDGRLEKYDIQEYAYKLEESINTIFTELKSITVEIFGEKSDVYRNFITLEKTVKNDFTLNKVGYDLNRISYFFHKRVSGMDPKYIDKVSDTLVGYTSFGFGTNLSAEANTPHEFLHFIHSYIVNNDSFLKGIPAIESKENNFAYPISLRGNDVPMFRELFENFPNDLDVGWTDMVAVNDNKLIMMVRDRGHALTIDITIKNDIARIEYFIPKLCNIDMIRALPGVNPVNENSFGATGALEVPVADMQNSLYDFISRVPMDSDMFLKAV